MDREDFWRVIDAVDAQSQGDMDRKCALVKRAVAEMPSSDATAFARHFDDAMSQSYTWGLWGAAYVAHGGCSDDTFTDFRASLVSRGKRSFEAAVANPDSLAQHGFDEDAWFYEGFQYAVYEGAETAVAPAVLDTASVATEPSGEPWEEEPEVLMALYPELWKKFASTWTADTDQQHRQAESQPNTLSPTPTTPNSGSTSDSQEGTDATTKADAESRPWWKFW